MGTDMENSVDGSNANCCITMQTSFNRIIRNITLVSIIVITPYNCGHSSVFAACIISEDDVKKKIKTYIGGLFL